MDRAQDLPAVGVIPGQQGTVISNVYAGIATTHAPPPPPRTSTFQPIGKSRFWLAGSYHVHMGHQWSATQTECHLGTPGSSTTILHTYATLLGHQRSATSTRVVSLATKGQPVRQISGLWATTGQPPARPPNTSYTDDAMSSFGPPKVSHQRPPAPTVSSGPPRVSHTQKFPLGHQRPTTSTPVGHQGSAAQSFDHTWESGATGAVLGRHHHPEPPVGVRRSSVRGHLPRPGARELPHRPGAQAWVAPFYFPGRGAHAEECEGSTTPGDPLANTEG